MIQASEIEHHVYCGRVFSGQEIAMIREMIRQAPELNRAQLSRLVSDKLAWRRPDGRLKDMSCRLAMLRMHRDGIIVLPPATTTNGNGRSRPRLTTQLDTEHHRICAPARQLGTITLSAVDSRRDSRLWNELIERYHYLGYKPLPGAKMRYFVFANRTLVALLGFNDAAWKAAPRDNFIGWSPAQRMQGLPLIVNNARFLILPWVQSKNLASRILAYGARQLPQDWHKQYGFRPVLIETFVEIPRFRGTCYRAANWVYVGQTKGRGKRDRNHLNALPHKDIYLYPLHKDFRTKLCQPSTV